MGIFRQITKDFFLEKVSSFKNSIKWTTIIFILFFLISLIIGFFVIKQNILSEMAFRELEQENIEGIGFLVKAENALWEIRYSLPNYATEGVLAREKIKQVFPKWLNELQVNLAKSSKLMDYPKEKAILENIDKELSEYLTFRSKYFSLIDEGKLEDANNYRLKFSKHSAEKAIAFLQQLIDGQQVEARQRSAEVYLQVRKTRILMFLYVMVIALLYMGFVKALDVSQKELELKINILSHNSKMASLGEMSSNIAHEINNPLAIIKGRSTLILKLLQTENFAFESVTDNVEKVLVATERITKIVKSMKSISRNTTNDPCSIVALKNMTENIESICAERFKANGIQLEIGTVPELNIECRSAEIEQVIFNLLNNAFDALAPLPEKWIHLDFKMANQQLQIMVTDSGQGIPPEIVKKLMFPFFTTKEVGLGTGLGLSISKNIIESHHGQLFYDSTCPNTRFVIELPLVQESEKLKAA